MCTPAVQSVQTYLYRSARSKESYNTLLYSFHGPLHGTIRKNTYFIMYSERLFRRTSPYLVLSAVLTSRITEEDNREIPVMVFPQN